LDETAAVPGISGVPPLDNGRPSVTLNSIGLAIEVSSDAPANNHRFAEPYRIYHHRTRQALQASIIDGSFSHLPVLRLIARGLKSR
jgi:hypothetical protein